MTDRTLSFIGTGGGRPIGKLVTRHVKKAFIKLDWNRRVVIERIPHPIKWILGAILWSSAIWLGAYGSWWTEIEETT